MCNICKNLVFKNHQPLIRQTIEISDDKQRSVKIMITANEAQQQLPTTTIT